MITVRRSNERGRGEHGWLDSRHTFSFAGYHDPKFMGFRSLRVINEDRVSPGKGFDTHGHSDMEIISYVLEGALEHKDSMGTGSIIRPGEVQKMSAGRGVEHSEFNASANEPVHFYQIWIMPNRRRTEPEYGQKAFPKEERLGKLRLVVSPDGRDGSLKIHQDASLYASLLEPGGEVVHRLVRGRFGWVQVARGELGLNGQSLQEGDGASVTGEETVSLSSSKSAEVLLFDLA